MEPENMIRKRNGEEYSIRREGEAREYGREELCRRHEIWTLRETRREDKGVEREK